MAVLGGMKLILSGLHLQKFIKYLLGIRYLGYRYDAILL